MNNELERIRKEAAVTSGTIPAWTNRGNPLKKNPVRITSLQTEI
jgi:hypothetical protein